MLKWYVVARMGSALSRLVVSSGAVFCVISAFAFAQSDDPRYETVLKKGVVVESVLKDQEGEKAGIKAGDVLLRWSRGYVEGKIDSPFELPIIRTEEASRGPLRLIGIRGSKKRTWILGSDFWGVWTYPNFQGELLSIYQKGQEFERVGKLDEAFEQWRKVAGSAEGGGIAWLGPWLLSRAARTYGDRRKGENDLNRQDDLYREAIERASHAGPEARADLYRLRADIYERRGDFVHLKKYRQAQLHELQELGMRMAASNVLNSLAWVEERQGAYSQAEIYVREALEISQKEAPNSAETVVGLQLLGSLLIEQGDLVTGAKYYQKALENVERNFPNSIRLVKTLEVLGTLGNRRGELEKARTYFQRALAVAERAAPSTGTVAQALGIFDEYLIDQGDVTIAERNELRALAIWQKVSPGTLAEASSLRNLGKIARVRGNLAEARQYYQQALAIGERAAPQSEETRRYLVGLGYVARDAGAPGLAEAYFRKALAIMDKSDPKSLDHAETVADLAGMLYRQDKFDAATKTYQQAFAELDENSLMGDVAEDRSHYRAYHSTYYKEYVDLLVHEGKTELAFEVTENSRVRTLLEMLNESHIDIQGADPVLLNYQRDLGHELNAKSQFRIRLLTEKHTDDQISSLDQDISNLRDRRAQLESQIRESSPSFAALTRPQSLDSNQIQQLLDPDTVLVEYSLGSDRSYVWLVTNSTVSIHELPKRDEIEAVARRLYHVLTARTRRVSNDTDAEIANWAKADALAQKLSSDLSQILLAPFASLIGQKRLLIVSDGALQYIPFSALPEPGNPGLPLIVQHEVVNLPSASVVAEIRRASADRPSAELEVAVLADPVFDRYDDRVTRVAAQSMYNPVFTRSSQRVSRSASDIGLTGKRDSYLARLVYSRDEAAAILAVTPRSKTLAALDFRANRSTALSTELAKYRIIHFATHGFLDSKRPEFSGLVLSLVDRQGKPQDGFLGLEDVYNMKLPVDLVVLSGCQTGLGEEISGEGLNGLTRGFMYAGASRVVASVWSVDDFTTSQLMAKFYRAMERDKMRPAAALRKAQIEIWKHKGWQAPYYWAAFQLQGEWQ